MGLEPDVVTGVVSSGSYTMTLQTITAHTPTVNLTGYYGDNSD